MGRKREETMGERLKRIREERGFSQTELAVAAGIPVGSLRSWERNRREPLLGSAARLAQALGVSIDVLAGVAPMPPAARKKGGK
jgi:transcriptional regulator with XRE-family HTH domain